MYFNENEFKAVETADPTQIASLDDYATAPKDDPPSPERLEVFCYKFKPIRNDDLKAAGWKRRKNAASLFYPEATHWVDIDTGEIFTTKQAKELGVEIGPSRSMRMIRTQSVIRSCKDSKRDFLLYILKHRNRRGGLITDLETTLNRWITYENPNMHTTDRSRKRNTLESFLYEMGVLANNQTFTKDFQFIGHSTKADYIGEESEYIYAYPISGKPGCGFPSATLKDRKSLMDWIKSKHAVAAPIER